MVIKPSNDNIVIKPEIEDTSKTSSGIVLATTKTVSRPTRGHVVAIGKGRVLQNGDVLPTDLKVNDYVIFNQFAGSEIVINKEKYLIVKENDILATITE